MADEEELFSSKDHLEKYGIDAVGPTNHTFFRSIYFFDPNGHRLELTVNTTTPDIAEQLSGTQYFSG